MISSLLSVCMFTVIYGEPQANQRIVGGVVTSIESIPYQVSLQYFNQHGCGGTIIGQQYVLTAAHCVEGVQPFILSVRAGSTYINKGGIVVKVCSYIMHDQYDGSTFDYDAAILLLCTKLPFTRGISPISLATTTNEPEVGSLGLVSGWGNTIEDGRMSFKLQKTMLRFIDHELCQEMYKDIGPVTSRMICAGSVLGRTDSCQGDSGGPLISHGVLVGLVSWGHGCGRPYYPGLYTRVASIRCWIKILIGY